MTSISQQIADINIHFFRNAAEMYGETGFSPSTEHSVGVDLRACLDTEEAVVIPPGERRRIPSGVAIEPLQPGFAAFVYSRSGLGAVTGLTVAQGVGVIDPDYRGEIIVYLLNTSAESHTVRNGDRIAQLVCHPVVRPHFNIVEALGQTTRGAGGFGHTGR